MIEILYGYEGRVLNYNLIEYQLLYSTHRLVLQKYTIPVPHLTKRRVDELISLSRPVIVLGIFGVLVNV